MRCTGGSLEIPEGPSHPPDFPGMVPSAHPAELQSPAHVPEPHQRDASQEGVATWQAMNSDARQQELIALRWSTGSLSMPAQRMTPTSLGSGACWRAAALPWLLYFSLCKNNTCSSQHQGLRMARMCSPVLPSSYLSRGKLACMVASWVCLYLIRTQPNHENRQVCESLQGCMASERYRHNQASPCFCVQTVHLSASLTSATQQ